MDAALGAGAGAVPGAALGARPAESIDDLIKSLAGGDIVPPVPLVPRLSPHAVALALALAAGPAGADGACPESVAAFRVIEGSIAPALTCGTFLVATDGWSGPFSRADIEYDKSFAAPFAVQVTWQRLGSDEGESLSLTLRGGYFLLRRGAYGFYAFSETAFAWHDLPGFSTQRESTVRVEQRPREIVLWVDGVLAGAVPFDAPLGSGNVGLGFKGASGYRSRMVFRDFSVTPLEEGAQKRSTSSPRSK